ncbi:cupin domain-containing protein [Parerythrobacter jejuensis]|uniref:Cupin domain-containing protein n=1 Tax=Parerythrobacter jejuensis TaxID=795812 RepID=A0A845AVV5_9SPHN|nr:cupin domain-containing protein [Parerythrobacter jejuensis]MXP30505.1 cupin domain-containing protein [Parerythrobacter jejuensis]MXP33265.1 cupin domain-containing protein [Parerythrobacter jejuensis]
MPKLDLDTIPQTNATGYPAPFDAEVEGRWYRRLAPAAGLDHIAATHVVLKPGAYSSQRHWHRELDELLVMVAGQAVLIEDDGETLLRPGDVVAWAAGAQNGHRLHNRSGVDCVFVVTAAGDRDADSGVYPDIDMVFDADGYARKDGTRYDTHRIP